MPPASRQRLWRTLAICMVLGAVWLAVYYTLIQQPLQADVRETQSRVTSLDQQIADAQKATPPVQAFPEPRFSDDCTRFEKALQAFPHKLDKDGTVFAVRELARNGELDHYETTSSITANTPVQSATRMRIQLALEGERTSIHNVLSNIRTYGKAGQLTSLTITPKDKDEVWDSHEPTLVVQANLDTFSVPLATKTATARCNALQPKK